ncbi:hypothetical protein BB561_004654 [Smittium simulii]|uniref:RRM domain-containing protein n=1 Tax=Smittium simulii TaxID=133385 RepID=A0A2T9YEZ0_9FUNG|nr:hypothetical protein BB561_004654 [Smittium simulii]
MTSNVNPSDVSEAPAFTEIPAYTEQSLSSPDTDSSQTNSNNLYVGNLDIRVNESMLFQIFSVIAPVKTCKIIIDKNHIGGPVCYSFVEFFEIEAAQLAIKRMDKRKIFDYEICVNWASNGKAQITEKQPTDFSIFVGDLASEVTEQLLTETFSSFASFKNAKVMIDPNTNQSRGFGFIYFNSHEDAMTAIQTMNGITLGSRQIRVNWASGSNANRPRGGQGDQPQNNRFNQDTSKIPIIYCCNLDPRVTNHMLNMVFSCYGSVVNINYFSERGYAFIEMHTVEQASNAISHSKNLIMYNKRIICRWSKENQKRNSSGNRNQNNNQNLGLNQPQENDPNYFYNQKTGYTGGNDVNQAYNSNSPYATRKLAPYRNDRQNNKNYYKKPANPSYDDNNDTPLNGDANTQLVNTIDANKPSLVLNEFATVNEHISL